MTRSLSDIGRSRLPASRDTHPSMDVAVAPCSYQVQPGGYIQLTPSGLFKAKDGRPHGLPGWTITDQTAPGVIANLSARQDKTLIDYEHQTLYTRENGQPAPAAGWFEAVDLQWRPGEGLFVKPQWTAAAKARIEAEEYKYLSPVIVYDKKTGEILDIQMAALVNYAAIDGMKELDAVAAAKFSHQHQEDPSMEELLKLFGLAPDANQEQAITALKALQEKAAAQSEKIAALNGVVEASKEALAAAKGETPDPAKYVPIGVVQQLQQEVAALKTRQDEGDIEDLVTQGIADGKIRGEAMETRARSMGVAALKAYLDSTAPIAALKGTQTQGKQPAGATKGELDETDLAVCKQLGLDPDAYKQTAALADA